MLQKWVSIHLPRCTDIGRITPHYNITQLCRTSFLMHETNRHEPTQMQSTKGEIRERIGMNSAHFLKDIKTTVIDVLRGNAPHKVTQIHTNNLPLTSSRYHCHTAYLSTHWIMWPDMFVKAGLLSGTGEYCRRQSRLREGTKREEDWQRGCEWERLMPRSLLLNRLHQPLTGFLEIQ